MSRRRWTTALAALALSIHASAASAEIRRMAAGIVERFEGVSYCMQGTHVLRDPCSGTSILLLSSTLDLDALLCEEVLVEGIDVGVECPVIDVENAQDRLTACASCDTGMSGVCADGRLEPPPGGDRCGAPCKPLTGSSAEICDALDNDCDGYVDEDSVCDGCAAGDADADGACDGADNCPALYNPAQEDLDADAEGDGCDLTISSPREGSTLDCRSGALPTVITWIPGPHDRYKVQISPEPGFPVRGRITNGDRWLTAPWWAVPARKWRRACGEASPYLYIRVLGVDAAARPKRVVYSEPARVDLAN